MDVQFWYSHKHNQYLCGPKLQGFFIEHRDSGFLDANIFGTVFIYIYIYYLDARQMYTMLFLAGLKACIEYHLTIKAVTASGLIGDMSTQR